MKRATRFLIFYALLIGSISVSAQEVLQPLIGDDTSTMTVTTHKIKKPKTNPPPIQLLSPAADSEFTPGEIEFSWKVNSKNKDKKMTFILEKLEAHRRVTQVLKNDGFTLSLKSGNYRWQVASGETPSESRWRSFEVVGRFGTGPLKRAPELMVDDHISKLNGDEAQVRRAQSSDDYQAGQPAEPDEKKLQEYKQEKLKTDQMAKDLKKQLEVAMQGHLQALEAAKKQAAELKAMRLERHQQEAKAKAEHERIAKLRAKQLIEIRLAKEKADRTTKILLARIQEENNAKLEAEKASRELAAKIEAERQTTSKDGHSSDDDDSKSARIPASQDSNKANHDDDLKWSDEP